VQLNHGDRKCDKIGAICEFINFTNREFGALGSNLASCFKSIAGYIDFS
jgi:hypothetical protein